MTLEHQKLKTSGLDNCLKVTNIRNKEEHKKSCGDQSCLPGSTLRFCQRQRSRPEVPKWAVQSTGSARGAALSHKDSVISQGPEPMARLKGRVRDHKRKGQAGLAWNFDVVLFTIQIPQRLCVPAPEGQRRSRLFGMQSATPLSPEALY